MSARDYLSALRRSWIVIVVSTIIAATAAVGVSITSTPSYTSRASVYFSLTFGDSANDLNQGSNYTQSQMQSFALLASSPIVLDKVIDELNLDVSAARLADAISIATPQDTVVLDISASSPVAQEAADIANAVAANLSEEVEQNAPENAQGEASISARVIAEARPPTFQSSPNTRLNLVAGLLLGVIFGTVIALLRQLLDTRVRSSDEIANLTDLPVLASIDRDSSLSREKLPVLLHPTAPIAEGFRQLRSNLQFVGVDNSNLSVLVTSSLPGEGKSIVASNLAIATAEAELTVILVDADLRRPAISNYFGVEGSVGLSTVIIGNATVDDVTQSGGHPNLTILPAGSIPPNPAVMLASRSMVEILTQLKERWDVVIIDSPPVLAVADASSIAVHVDGVVIVADSTKARRAQVKEAIENLASAGAATFGLVLNRLAAQPGRYVYYGPRKERAGWRRLISLHRRVSRDNPSA